MALCPYPLTYPIPNGTQGKGRIHIMVLSTNRQEKTKDKKDDRLVWLVHNRTIVYTTP